MEEQEFAVSPFGNVSFFDIPSILINLKFRQIVILKNYVVYALLGIKTVDNFPEVAFGLLKNRGRIVMKFRDGSQYEVAGKNLKRTLYLLLHIKDKKYDILMRKDFGCVEFDFDKQKIVLEGPDCLGLAYDVFFRREYGKLFCKGRTVIDIGANIGDTAVYFAAGGAKTVIAFEPYPYSYSLAKRNIEKNGFGNVLVLNAGAGGNNHTIIVDEKKVTVGGSQLSASDSGRKVPILSLESIVCKYLKNERGVLKMDCEGYEYEILLSAPNEAIRAFDEMMVEFHYGHANLEKRLKECGFEVRIIIRPSYFYCEGWKYPHGRVGMLYAKRRV
ncbi:TPA: FkbM family methyltransferase [Candidatus Micrarchaeota archaeon]|nr:FkbM family methyltransferase [Candidatus Micrarchaeota archaeon]